MIEDFLNLMERCTRNEVRSLPMFAEMNVCFLCEGNEEEGFLIFVIYFSFPFKMTMFFLIHCRVRKTIEKGYTVPSYTLPSDFRKIYTLPERN